MVTLVKTNRTEAERIGGLLNHSYRQLRWGYTQWIRRATAKEVLESVAASVTVANVERVLRIVDAFVDQYANLFSQTFVTVAGREADVWTGRLRPMLKAGENIDITDQQIAYVLNRNKLNLINNLTRQQRDVIRTALIDGIRAGETPTQTARRFRNVLGLTSQQYQALSTYQTLLENTSGGALRVAGRNPKFDATISRAIDENDVLTATQIETMLGAYATNLRTMRAETIANTEGLKMVNQARDLALRQVAQRAGINASRGRKVWLLTSSAEPRDDHLAMVGTEVGMDEPFTLPNGRRMMYPGDTSLGAGARDVVNCKCGIDYIMEE